MDTEKEYVLVSQGIEIYRTKDKADAEATMQENNEAYEKYLEKCAREGEYNPVDNEIFMYEEP